MSTVIEARSKFKKKRDLCPKCNDKLYSFQRREFDEHGVTITTGMTCMDCGYKHVSTTITYSDKV